MVFHKPITYEKKERKLFILSKQVSYLILINHQITLNLHSNHWAKLITNIPNI